jgi:hypothetical protein
LPLEECLTELRRALLANKADVENALSSAESELADLRLRCADLEQLIERARQLLSVAEPGQPKPRRALTLHEAMELVLRESSEALSAPAIAAEINRRGLYMRRDGRPIDSGQIHARVGGYGALFARTDRRITLREASAA